MKRNTLQLIIKKIMLDDRGKWMGKGLLIRKSEVPRPKRGALLNALDELVQTGEVMCVDGKYALTSKLTLIKGEIVKVSSGFCFAKDENEQNYFIPGRFSKGAMVGDEVLLEQMSHEGDSPEAQVLKVLSYSQLPFVATVKKMRVGYGLVPDQMPNFTFKVKLGKEQGIQEGDKVSAKIFKRGESHFDHMAAPVKIYGDAQKAQVCAWAILDDYQIKKQFGKDTLQEAKTVFQTKITKQDRNTRLDLTDACIFTIDSAESKDLDDAISLQKTTTGYELGVHIADVSHFVTPKSALDNEAFTRGTSVYYADQVIPMLPQELSNGICSLHPGEEKLSFSAILQLDEDGYLVSYDFQKSIVNSKVKGVYSEVNALLAGASTRKMEEKYATVKDSLFLMEALYEKLVTARKKRHAIAIESDEAKFVIDEKGDPVDILVRTRGKSEEMIEEFMILANQASAKFSEEKKLPFLYRVHQAPGDKKISNYVAFLRTAGINPQIFEKAKITPADFGEILERVKGTPLHSVVNMQTLRSMEKARYSTEEIGHFGLALSHYSHFTSPIRRYPDLVIHRVLSDFLAGASPAQITQKYSKFVSAAAADTSRSEVNAVDAERACESAYKAQYMTQFIGDVFEAKIVSVTNFGLYVALDNTVEGLVHIEQLPEGNWSLREGYSYDNEGAGRRLILGDTVQVQLLSTNVSLGQVDFTMKIKG